MSRNTRCPSCGVDPETAENTYEVVGNRGGRTLYLCSACGTQFQGPGREKDGTLPETVNNTLAGPRSNAHESVIRVSEAPAKRPERSPRVNKAQNRQHLAGAATNKTGSDPDPINLHSDVGWVYPATPDKYHFDWEPPDLGQEPPSKWRRNWNEAVNMIKYFRLVNDPIPPRPSREKGTSQVYRGLEELRELKPTDPDAI